MTTTGRTYTRETRSDEKTITRDFGVKDRFGRKLGTQVRTWTGDFAVTEEKWGHTQAPGRYFLASPHSTRDGVAYGPVQSYQSFATAADRDAYVAKYLDGAQKRGIKAAAKSLAKVQARPVAR